MSRELSWAVGPALLLAVCAFAWLKGAPAERYGSLLILALNLLADFALALTYPRFPGLILALLDFTLSAGLIILAVRYSSVWLGLAMLLQSVSLCSHAFLFDGFGLGPTQRVELNNGVSYLMLVCMVVASTISWHSRSKRSGEAAPTYAPAGLV